MLSASVSNVELFRMWRSSEDLDTEWLLRRLRGDEPQTAPMKAGEAFHKALENLQGETEVNKLESGPYEFIFTCDCEIALTEIKELRIQKQYGQLEVRGRIDAMRAGEVTDYKTTGQFDPDRLLEGYQWRFYLDMLGCNKFIWKVFVLSEDSGYYKVIQTHALSQYRYAGMEQDCERLASDYADFVSNPSIARELSAKVGA